MSPCRDSMERKFLRKKGNKYIKKENFYKCSSNYKELKLLQTADESPGGNPSAKIMYRRAFAEGLKELKEYSNGSRLPIINVLLHNMDPWGL